MSTSKTKNSASAKSGKSTTSPSKSNRKVRAAEKANIEKAAKDVKTEAAAKELIYNYPADVKTAAAKKAFRRNARAAKNRFDKAITKLKGSNKPEDKKALATMETERKAWAKETYTHPS